MKKLTDTVRTLASMWKNLSAGLKDHYMKVAAEDKARYFSELKEYTGTTPPLHFLFSLSLSIRPALFYP